MKITHLLRSTLAFAFFTALLGRAVPVFGGAPTWEWVRSVPNDPGRSSGVATDSAGNVYWAGGASSGNLGSVRVHPFFDSEPASRNNRFYRATQLP